MKVRPSLMLIGVLLLVIPVAAQQPAEKCKAKITYENRNQIDPRPLSIDAVFGIAQDKDEVPIPNVCLGLFTEREHQLLGTAVTDQKGRFNFGRVKAGRYRLVAKYEGFCTANVPVQVKRRSSKLNQGGKRLVFHMHLAEIDSCSYADYK